MNAASKTKSENNLESIYANAWLNGMIQVMKVKCEYELKLGKSALYDEHTEVGADVCATIGFTSDAFKGTIALCFPKALFLELTGKLNNKRELDVSNRSANAAGDLLNSLFVSAKATLAAEGHNLEKTIPCLMSGDGIRVTPLLDSVTTLVVPFDCNKTKLHVLISLSAAQKGLKAVGRN